MARQRKFPRHFVIKASGFYFQATPAMRKAGIFSESLGTDLTAAKARAKALNASWDAIRRGLEPTGPPPARPPVLSAISSSVYERQMNTAKRNPAPSMNSNTR